MEEGCIPCHKCRKLIPQYDLKKTEGGNLICINCNESETYHTSVERFKELKKQKPKAVQQPVTKQQTKKKYFCNSCRYNFERFKFREEEMCPYCGEKGTVQMSEFLL